MAKNKMKMQFDGFSELAEQFDKLGGSIKEATDAALRDSQKIVAAQSHAPMKKHHRTGDTEESIIEGIPVEWNGTLASVGVGFNISNGGFPSIFLMYGTPRRTKDQAVYNAVYGSKVRKQIAEVQEKAIRKAIAERMGG